MMVIKIIRRFFHIQGTNWSVEKSHLGALRKKTGYTFANCKKALEMHNNNLSEAESWLKQQAQALGWSKATKLEGRQTSQGLVAVAVNNKNAVLVEVNCETDFVARNEHFQKVVIEAARSCLSFSLKQPSILGKITRIGLDSEQLQNLPANDGKSLADHLALMIGTVGENASLKRGFCLKADDNVVLAGYAHPLAEGDKNVLLGRFGGVVAIKQTSYNEGVNLSKIGKEICQHIVGMNPHKIGDANDIPANNKDEEDCLIHQEFLLDDSVTVKDILEQNQIEIVDFKRFQCGEDIHPSIEQKPVEQIETCQ